MAGLDPISMAAGKAVDVALDAGHGQIAERKAEHDALRRAAEPTQEMERAGRLYGQRAAIKQRALLTLMQPLKWAHLVPAQYFEAEFIDDLSAKLDDVAPEDLVAPKANVAIPAMQGLALNLDEPQLKEMYLNLLAGASTASRARSVHPSFVHVLQQLSSDEVPTLDWCLREAVVPAVRVKLVGVNGWTLKLLRSCVIDRPVPTDDFERWLSNWESLGLVEVTLGGEHALGDSSGTDHYAWVEGHPAVAEERALLNSRIHNDPLPPAVDFVRGAIRATSRGLDFHRVVSTQN